MLRILIGIAGFFAGWLFAAHRGAGPEVIEPNEERMAEPDIVEPHEELQSESVDFVPLAEELSELTQVAAALRESAAALDKQLGRVGREQFKVNTLDETRQRQAQAALEQLRDLDSRREADVALLRDQLRADQSAQRLTVIQQLLPALDGLDEALAAGRRLLGQPPAEKPVVSDKMGFSQRLAFVLGRGAPPTGPAPENGVWRDSVAAWLEGLDLVRGRLLQVLAAEGVQPMTALGEPFDPHLHVAVQAVPAREETAPGTVVEEYRRGYQFGDRILHAAEVVVAR